MQPRLRRPSRGFPAPPLRPCHDRAPLIQQSKRSPPFPGFFDPPNFGGKRMFCERKRRLCGRKRKRPGAQMPRAAKILGGDAQIRTGGKGFAGLCLTTWPRRLVLKRPIWKTGPFTCNGADNGARTRDPHLGKVVLYQLSHVRLRGITIRKTARACKQIFEKTEGETVGRVPGAQPSSKTQRPDVNARGRTERRPPRHRYVSRRRGRGTASQTKRRPVRQRRSPARRTCARDVSPPNFGT